MTAGLQARDMYCDPCEVNDCCPDFCCDMCGDVTVFADYLYWTARRCELDYAVPSTGSASFIGDVHTLCPKYDSGFRVGGLYRCGNMDIEARYAYFYSSSRDSFIDAVNGDIAGTRIIDDIGAVTQGSIELAKADWDIHYNMVDVRAGYNLDVGNCFDFRLFTGLKFAFINQDLNVLYSTDTNVTGATNSFDLIYEKLDMDGYGLTFGFDTLYRICNCLGITGTFYYDVLVSEFDRRELYRTTTNGGSTFTTDVDLRDKCYRTVSDFNLALGLQYDIQLCGCYDVFLAAGYEFHHYLNMADFLGFQSESGETTFDRQTDGLGLDGLFVRLGVGF